MSDFEPRYERHPLALPAAIAPWFFAALWFSLVALWPNKNQSNACKAIGVIPELRHSIAKESSERCSSGVLRILDKNAYDGR